MDRPQGGAWGRGEAALGAAELCLSPEAELAIPLGKTGLAVSPKGVATSHLRTIPVAVGLEAGEACVHVETPAGTHYGRTFPSLGNAAHVWQI